MKKILALVLVLGMASMANAALTLQVQDGTGQWIPAVSSEIFLVPSDTITGTVVLGLHESEQLPGGFNAWIGIPEGQMQLGEWTGNNTIISPPAQADAYLYTYGSPYYGFSYWTLSNAVVSTEPQPGGLVATFEFHCKEIGDVDITFGYNGPTDPQHEVLTIHQIPEPMTMALLGLGGLALIRRRR
jgi:hypothetical protein